MKIRTAIFGVYVAASAVGFAVLMGLVLRDVRLCYVEAMRRTMGDTASFLAVFAGEAAESEANWAQRLSGLPPRAELLRVFASDVAGRVIFDSTRGRDVGQLYPWPMTGCGSAASENYTLANVAEVGGELRVRARVRRGGQLRSDTLRRSRTKKIFPSPTARVSSATCALKRSEFRASWIGSSSWRHWKRVTDGWRSRASIYVRSLEKSWRVRV